MRWACFVLLLLGLAWVGPSGCGGPEFGAASDPLGHDGSADGCDGTQNCGTCTFPQTCEGAGVPNQCGCTPRTCDQLGLCGEYEDGCGGWLNCPCLRGVCQVDGTCGIVGTSCDGVLCLGQCCFGTCCPKFSLCLPGGCLAAQ